MLLALALYASTAHAASPPDSVERPASSTRTRRTTTSSCWGVKARMAATRISPRPRVTLRRCGAGVKGQVAFCRVARDAQRSYRAGLPHHPEVKRQ